MARSKSNLYTKQNILDDFSDSSDDDYRAAQICNEDNDFSSNTSEDNYELYRNMQAIPNIKTFQPRSSRRQINFDRASEMQVRKSSNGKILKPSAETVQNHLQFASSKNRYAHSNNLIQPAAKQIMGANSSNKYYLRNTEKASTSVVNKRPSDHSDYDTESTVCYNNSKHTRKGITNSGSVQNELKKTIESKLKSAKELQQAIPKHNLNESVLDSFLKRFDSEFAVNPVVTENKQVPSSSKTKNIPTVPAKKVYENSYNSNRKRDSLRNANLQDISDKDQATFGKKTQERTQVKKPRIDLETFTFPVNERRTYMQESDNESVVSSFSQVTTRCGRISRSPSVYIQATMTGGKRVLKSLETSRRASSGISDCESLEVTPFDDSASEGFSKKIQNLPNQRLSTLNRTPEKVNSNYKRRMRLFRSPSSSVENNISETAMDADTEYSFDEYDRNGYSRKINTKLEKQSCNDDILFKKPSIKNAPRIFRENKSLDDNHITEKECKYGYKSEQLSNATTKTGSINSKSVSPSLQQDSEDNRMIVHGNCNTHSDDVLFKKPTSTRNKQRIFRENKTPPLDDTCVAEKENKYGYNSEQISNATAKEVSVNLKSSSSSHQENSTNSQILIHSNLKIRSSSKPTLPLSPFSNKSHRKPTECVKPSLQNVENNYELNSDNPIDSSFINLSSENDFGESFCDEHITCRDNQNQLYTVVKDEVISLDWFSQMPNMDSNGMRGVSIKYSLPNLKSHLATSTVGYLKIQAGKQKPLQVAKKHSILYKVDKGQAIIKLFERKKVADVGSTFYIPLGAEYTILNPSSENDLLLFFVKMSDP